MNQNGKLKYLQRSVAQVATYSPANSPIAQRSTADSVYCSLPSSAMAQRHNGAQKSWVRQYSEKSEGTTNFPSSLIGLSESIVNGLRWKHGHLPKPTAEIACSSIIMERGSLSIHHLMANASKVCPEFRLKIIRIR